MSDGQGGVMAEAIGGVQQPAPQDQGGGDGGQQQQQQQPGADQGGGEARWQDKFLSPELRNIDALGTYKSLDDLAKAHVETQKWARGRVAVPGAEDATAFEEFAGKVRPQDAAAYKIADQDGKPSETGEAFRQVFHDIGLHPIQAERLNAAWNQHASDAISKATQAGRDELKAVELDLGPQAYNQRLTAVDNLLRGAGLDYADLLPAMEQSFGAGKAMQALFAIAEKTGELAKVDGAQVQLRMGGMDAKAASAEIDRMDADAETRTKVLIKGSPERVRRDELMAIVRKG